MHDVVLQGKRVILEPLKPEHADALARAVTRDDDVWTWMSAAPATVEEMGAWIKARRRGRPFGRALAFVQRAPASDALMGSTCLFDIDEAQACGEIGFTWLAAPYRGTGVNTEAKLLLLRYAFETLGLRRVQLVTDARNLRSQRAITKLGATREGILRNHRRDRTGALRDSVYFSILDREWPDVKTRLEIALDGR